GFAPADRVRCARGRACFMFGTANRGKGNFLAVCLFFHPGRDVCMALIHVSNLTFAYEGSSDPVFENVNLRLDTDWKLGFTGRNGRGKTTFLHLLMGKYEYGGTISTSVSFDYFPFPVAD